MEINYDPLDAGYSTARLGAAEQDRLAREQREAAARRYLLAREDLADVAEILGLIPPTTPPPRRKRKIPAPREDN